MRNGTTKKAFAVTAVLFMLLSASMVVVGSGESEAATADWKCTITISGTSLTTTYEKNGASVNVSQVVGTTGNAGSWGYDSDGYGPFGSFYAAFDPNNKNKMICHLDPSNLKQSIDKKTKVEVDGTTVAISDCNIMWCLPKIYLSVSGSTLTMSSSLSDGKLASAFKVGGTEYNYLALGVYEATYVNSKLGSISGKSPQASTPLATYRTEAKENEFETDSDGKATGVAMLWNYHQYQLYRMCSLAVMENFDSQTQIGWGNSNGSSSTTTGTLDAEGPYYGCASTNSKTDGAKLFIENAWGSLYEYVDDAWWATGLYAGQNLNPTSDKNDKTDMGVVTTLSGYGTAPYSTSLNSWGLPTATGSSSTTAPDYIYTKSSGSALIVGGSWGNGAAAGLSYLGSYGDGGYSRNGSRLSFLFAADSAATPTVTYDHSALTDMGGDATGLATSGKIEDSAIYPDLNDSTLAAMQDGYKHIGWYVDETFVAIGTTVTKTTSHTAYSAWVAPQITITFYAEGEVYATLAVPKGTAGVVLTPVMVEGVFEGWYTDSAFQNKYDGTQKFNENTNLYAKGVPPLVFTSVPTATASIANVTANMYYFDATDSTGRYAIEWDFGDGNTSTDPIAYNTYTDPGHYTVTLKITNLYGDTDTKTYGIDVGDVKEQTDAPSKTPAIIGIFAVIVLSALVVRRFV